MDYELFPSNAEQMPEEIPGQLSLIPEKPRQPKLSEQRIGLQYATLESPVLDDPSRICILICDILKHFDGCMPEQWIYDIMLKSCGITFFIYSEAIGFLTDNGSIVLEQNNRHEDVYYLTKKGLRCADDLRKLVPKLFRDQVMLAALKYASHQKALRDLEVSYEPQDSGCAVCLRCMDQAREMFYLRIQAPTEESAKLLGEKVLLNPAGFFGRILDLALNNEEEEFDLSDN
ncbi:MAG: DUF4364 family protein [Oscillospiraceae bacterium]|nr:DUF4364 family protein [Oscillospiraceae bacterium]